VRWPFPLGGGYGQLRPNWAQSTHGVENLLPDQWVIAYRRKRWVLIPLEIKGMEGFEKGEFVPAMKLAR